MFGEVLTGRRSFDVMDPEVRSRLCNSTAAELGTAGISSSIGAGLQFSTNDWLWSFDVG